MKKTAKFTCYILVVISLFFQTGCQKKPDKMLDSEISSCNLGSSASSETQRTQSSRSATDSSSETSLAATSSVSSAQESAAAESSSALTEQKPTADTQPAGCSHTYKSETLPPTCSESGYTVHTCTKCGQSYTDTYTAPHHEYGKYTCIYCGKPDPKQVKYSIGAWLTQRGELGPNGNLYIISKVVSGDIYDVFCMYGKIEGIYITVSSGNEFFRIYFKDESHCSIIYTYDGVTHGYMDSLYNGNVYSGMSMSWTGDDDKPLPEDKSKELSSHFAARLDGFMNNLESQILLPEAELRLSDLGFTMYS